MTLKTDPSEARRLIGDNTSEIITLLSADAVTNFPLGVWLLEGDDLVFGSIANDLVYGNEGEDNLGGDLGNDYLLGGKGKDFLIGEAGNDSLSGGQDADFMLGEAGNDILWGGRGNDWLESGNGNDTLVGGLGHDILGGVEEKIGGSNLYVLQAEAGVKDVNNADHILGFRAGLDRIGLAGGLTPSDVNLQYVTNVTIFLELDLPESSKQFAPPGTFNTKSLQTQGTLIKVGNSGDIVGFVEDARVTDIQARLSSVQGF